eukprot:GILK01003156.1.p1 GENE.GILK01003156.1~~GILK01003156.1.p1  ORF type:complete len:464 (-),score=39.76 GILK01003156.1:338-1729(-)
MSDDFIALDAAVAKEQDDSPQEEITLDLNKDHLVSDDDEDAAHERDRDRKHQSLRPKSPSPPETLPAEFRVVRLRGLPWSATDDDIRGFFKDLSIVPNGTYIVLNHQGRPSGEAFAEFATDEDGKLAIGRHKQLMGRRYVEVFPSTASALACARRKDKSAGLDISSLPKDVGVLRLRGMPFSASTQDIIAFFDGFRILPHAVQILTHFNGKPRGEAFAVFESKEEAKRALTKQNAVMGQRYIELFESDLSELAALSTTTAAAEGPVNISGSYSRSAERDRERGRYDRYDDRSRDRYRSGPRFVDRDRDRYDDRPRSRPYDRHYEDRDFRPSHYDHGPDYDGYHMHGGGGYGGSYGGSYGYPPAYSSYSRDSRDRGEYRGRYDTPMMPSLKMRGLPYRCTKDDIKMFFADYDVTTRDITILMNAEGRPSGEAVVTFQSESACHRALEERNRKYIGDRYVELCLV